MVPGWIGGVGGAPETSGVWGWGQAGDRLEGQQWSMLTHCARVTRIVPFYSVPYPYAVLRRCELVSLRLVTILMAILQKRGQGSSRVTRPWLQHECTVWPGPHLSLGRPHAPSAARLPPTHG